MRGHFWSVFTYELLRNIRRPGFLFTTFGVPVVLFALTTLISGAAASNNPADDPEAMQELTAQFEFGDIDDAGFVDLTGLFDDAPLPETWTRYTTSEEAQAAVQSGTQQVVYIIESDFAENGTVTTVLPEFQFNRLGDDNLARLVRGYFAQGIDPAVTSRLFDPATYTETNLSLTTIEGGEANEDASFLLVYAFVITLITTLFMTNGYLMQTLIEEKETRLIEILVASLRPMQLLAGKILALGLLGLLQVSVWVFGMIALTSLAGSGERIGQSISILATLAQIQIPLDLLPILFMYFVLSYLLFAAVYSIISAFSNSMREGPQYAVLFVLPAMAPLYFLPVFASSPDASFAVFLSIFPLTAPVSMTARLVVTEVPAFQIALSIGLLALSVVVAMWIAARVFRAGILLAGSPPKLRDIPMLIRG